jgi:threonine/homoserine/homoserine lactone efflux protein
MPKILAIVAMSVAGLILLLFLLDLAIKVPFKRPSVLMEVFFSLGAAIVVYLGWEVYREVS